MSDSSLDQLASRVETRPGSEFTARHRLASTDSGAQHEFPAVQPPPPRSPMKNFFSPLEYLFMISIVFFIGAATYAGLQYYSGSNTVSTKNVSLTVAGPTSVRAGDELSLDVAVTNHNAVPIRTVDLFLEFPQGTRAAGDVSRDFTRTRISLDTIGPGQSVTRTVKAVVFGARGAPVDVSSYITYRVPSSNAVLRNDSAFAASISSAPVSLSVSSLKEAVSGQSVDMTVTATSNAAEPLTKMILVATYPPGFTFESSTPSPSSGTRVWNLDTLAPGAQKAITIRGTFTGEDGDDRVIHFTTGTRQAIDETAINAPLASTDVSLKVARPFVSVDLLVGGAIEAEHPISRGQEVEGIVRWANNLPVSIEDVEIELKLTGAILDRSSIKSSDGFYRSADTTILFSKDTDARLASVPAGASNESRFTFAALPLDRGVFKSSQIQLTATVKGKRSSESGVVESIASSASTRAVVSTNVAVSAALQATGGPVPPKVDTPTAYTVTWSVRNSSNAIANTVLTATLPAYVAWGGGASDQVSYNESTRTITWTIGDMNGNEQQSQSFSVSLTPSLQHLKGTPPVLQRMSLTAFDRFTRTTITATPSDVTTVTGATIERGTVVP